MQPYLRDTFLLLVIWITGTLEAKDPLAVIPEDGSTVDLGGAQNGFLRVSLSHAYGAKSDISFTVLPPRDRGIVTVIHSMELRRGVPVIGPSECYEYVKFSSVDTKTGNLHSAFACGSITDNDFELVGQRSFVTRINNNVTIQVHFSNDFGSGQSSSNPASERSIFLLDITAYTDCKSESTNQEPMFHCTSTMCIPWIVHCDGNYNCAGVGNGRIPMQDELNCQVTKRESNGQLFIVTPEPSSSTTEKPLLGFDISSAAWPWNWGSGRQKTSTTTSTTEKPTYVINYYDHGHDHDISGNDDYYTSWWNSQMPLITAIIIFLGISCLLFGMCSYLAKWNTRRHTVPETVTHSPRRQETGVPNHYSIPAPEGRVYFYPECDNRAYLHTPPPPAYQDHGRDSPEAPPSYNTLFRKNTNSPYASEGTGTGAGTVAHTISVPPVYDRSLSPNPR